MKMLKKLLAAALILSCVAGILPAQAETRGLSISFKNMITLAPGESQKALITKVNAAQGDTIVYSLTDMRNKTVVFTDTVSGVAVGQEIAWTVPYDETGLTPSKPVKEMRASFVYGGKTYTFNLYYTYSEKMKKPNIDVEKATWYSNNTACSFGPAFRDEKSSLTDKWYTFTPVDLSIQGRQEFEYVASNMYVIGKVFVDVSGDQVRVTYENLYAQQDGNTQTLTEFLTFFHDLASVKQVEPEKMDDLGFRFGETISIEKDLEGDAHVLLFIRNQVTYCNYVNNTHKLVRFWPNLPERKELRERMKQMMNL